MINQRPQHRQDLQTRWQPPRRGGVNVVRQSRQIQSSLAPPMDWCNSIRFWVESEVLGPHLQVVYHGPRHWDPQVRCWRAPCPMSTLTPSHPSGTWTLQTAPQLSCDATQIFPLLMSAPVLAVKVNRQGSATTTLRWSTTPSWERK